MYNRLIILLCKSKITVSKNSSEGTPPPFFYDMTDQVYVIPLETPKNHLDQNKK